MSDKEEKGKSERSADAARPSQRHPYYGGYGSYYGAYGAYPAGAHGSDITSLVRRWMGILKRRWLSLALVVAFCLAAAAYRISTARKIYTASSNIEILARRPRIYNRDGAVLDDSLFGRDREAIINTKLDKLNGPETLQRVVQYLEQNGDPQPHNVAGAFFSPVMDSYLVRITCRHTDPERAAASANAYAEVAGLLAFEENKNDSESAVEWLKAQATEQRKALEKAEQAIVEFRTTHGLDMLQSRKETAADKVTQLNRSLGEVRARLIQTAEMCGTLEKLDLTLEDIGELPDSAPGIGEIRDEVGKWRTASAERDTLLAKYRAQHPKVVAASKAVEAHEQEALGAIERARATARSNLELIERQAASIGTEIEKQRSDAAEMGLKYIEMTGQLEGLQRAKQAADLSYGGILRRIEEARLSADENTTTVKVVRKASVPRVPSSPDARKILHLALLIGLVLGAALAFVTEVLDDVVTSSAEIEEELGLCVLGVIPFKKGMTQKRLVRQGSGHGMHAMMESFAGIRTFLCSPQFRESSSSLLVTSPAPEEGKTVVACSIAMSLARSGAKTLLVDFDMRRPAVRRVFPEVGDSAVSLMEVLSLGDAAAERFPALPCRTEYENLDVVITRHDSDVNPSSVVGCPTVGRFAEWAKSRYDNVVFDCPPHGLLSDAAMLAGHVNGVIIVCWANRTRRHSLRMAAKHFERVGANVLGVVVNGVRFGRGSYFSTYDYYHAGYYHPSYFSKPDTGAGSTPNVPGEP